MKIKKIAELAFHSDTNEPEAIAAFLALRRLKGGLTELKNILNEPKPVEEHISSWVISGPDSYIGRVMYVGCSLVELMDGKCHITKNKKTVFIGQKYTVTLKYSTKYSVSVVEREFTRNIKK